MSELPMPSPSAGGVGSLGAGRVRRAPGALRSTAAAAADDREWRRTFVEEFGKLDLIPNRPRASMRVLGFMVVCRPDLQSAQQIMEELALSAGSVSTAVNALHDDGLLCRLTRAGDRHVYYRLSPQGWERVVRARFRTLVEVRRVADRALCASRGEGDCRLSELRDTYARLEEGLTQLLVRDA